MQSNPTLQSLTTALSSKSRPVTDESTLLPSQTRNDAGEPRKVGVEIEFGGLDVKTSAELVAQVFGGDIVAHTDYIEVDMALIAPEYLPQSRHQQRLFLVLVKAAQHFE